MTDPKPTANVSFRYQPARRVRSFEDVVDQIRASIVTGSLPVGERLPSERELSEMFGVSRPTLREALRVLEAMGLLDIRLGSQGGAYAGGDDNAPPRVISALLATQAASDSAALIELRAMHHADNANWIDRIAYREQRSLGGHDDEAHFLRALARSTGNNLLVLLSDAIEFAVSEAALDVPHIPADTRSEVDRLLEQDSRARAREVIYDSLSLHPRADLD